MGGDGEGRERGGRGTGSDGKGRERDWRGWGGDGMEGEGEGGVRPEVTPEGLELERPWKGEYAKWLLHMSCMDSHMK